MAGRRKKNFAYGYFIRLHPYPIDMKYPRYPVTVSDDLQVYEFYSEGPRGRIKKTITYTQIGRGLFNLAFGDWNEEKQLLDDSNRSNNGDRDQVLATVAYTALNFFSKYRNVQVFIEGSTYSRTRLYQMGIAANYLEISANFEVKGFVEEHWELFRQGRNYESFLICRK